MGDEQEAVHQQVLLGGGLHPGAPVDVEERLAERGGAHEPGVHSPDMPLVELHVEQRQRSADGGCSHRHELGEDQQPVYWLPWQRGRS